MDTIEGVLTTARKIQRSNSNLFFNLSLSLSVSFSPSIYLSPSPSPSLKPPRNSLSLSLSETPSQLPPFSLSETPEDARHVECSPWFQAQHICAFVSRKANWGVKNSLRLLSCHPQSPCWRHSLCESQKGSGKLPFWEILKFANKPRFLLLRD